MVVSVPTRYGVFQTPTELVGAFQADYQDLLDDESEDDFFHFWGDYIKN